MAGISRVQRAALLAARRLGLAAQSRSFGAAALQDYYYDDEEEEKVEVRLEPRAETLGSMAGRGVQWSLIGYPGVQKHIYAARLSKLLEVPHISMGSLVRQELNPRSSLYKQIANAVNEGKLVPEDIIFGLLSKRLEEGYLRGETGFILDGLPRTRIQAEILDQIADIDLVVNFKCNKDCLLKQHLGSGICACCGKSSNMSGLQSASLPQRSEELAQHTQLNSCAIAEDAWNEKLRIYTEQSKPLEDYYRKQRKLLDFHVASGPGETWQGLLAALRLQHMDALNSSSSPKLSA